jgi:antitoxin ChpS
MLAVPPAILDLLDLHAGATVGLAVDGGRLIVEPLKRPAYTLELLLAQSSGPGELDDDDREWLAGNPVGGELL